MAVAIGKAQIAAVALMLGLITSLGIGIVIYKTQEGGLTYEVTLNSINTDYENVWGSVTLKVTNDNDFDVSFVDVKVELADPITQVVFYTFEHEGSSVEANGGTLSERIDFTLTYDDIPEEEILVYLSGTLTYNNNVEFIEREIPVPLVWDF